MLYQVRAYCPVPHLGCVDLRHLPAGRVISRLEGDLDASDVGLEPFHMLLLDVVKGSFNAKAELLESIQTFYKVGWGDGRVGWVGGWAGGWLGGWVAG